MEDNPIAKKGYTEKKYYPIKIVCIVDDYSEASTPLIQSIRDHTLARGAIFQTRIYDSRKRSEDRDYVQRLPAFHIYEKKSYIETFYPNTRPLQHVDEAVESYVLAEKRRTARILPSLATILGWIRKFLTRKTAMEKYQEEQAKITSNDFRKPLPISEWN